MEEPYHNGVYSKHTKDFFENHSWYFRNALVRANYNDWKKGVHATTKYLDYTKSNLRSLITMIKVLFICHGSAGESEKITRSVKFVGIRKKVLGQI